MAAEDKRGSGFDLSIHTDTHAVVVQTETNRIHGNIHVRENERVKDALNTSDLFIAMTDVRILDVHGMTLLTTTDFLAINRQSIAWVMEDNQAAGQAKLNT
jgi:hypothetical protein